MRNNDIIELDKVIKEDIVNFMNSSSTRTKILDIE